MKNIKYLLLLILLIPINIYAYEFTCEEGPFEYEQSFHCYIKGDNSFEYDEISGDIELIDSSMYTCEADSYDNGLTKVDSTTAFKYKGLSTSDVLVSIKCTVSSKPAATGSEQIVIPNFKYHKLDDNNDASTEVLRSNNVKYNAYIEQQHKKDDKPRNTDHPESRLKSITDKNLDFTFSTFKTEYDLSVKYEVDKIEPVIIPYNADSSVEVVGSYDLEIGENVIDIYVTSASGEYKTCYTLNITRLKRGEEIYYLNKDSSLSSLTIEGYNINFESIVHEYNIHLGYNVSSVKVTAEATNPKADVNISNTNNLKNGDAINVTVTAEDKSVSTIYIIHIKKDAPPKDNKNKISVILLVSAITIVIIIIIYTNVKNKGNPLLKREPKEKNKKLNKEDVPDANAKENIIQPSNEVVPQEQVETLQAPVQQVPVEQPNNQPVVTTPVEQPVQQEQPVNNNVQTNNQPGPVETFEINQNDVMNNPNSPLNNQVQTSEVTNNGAIPTPPAPPVVEPQVNPPTETNIFN